VLIVLGLVINAFIQKRSENRKLSGLNQQISEKNNLLEQHIEELKITLENLRDTQVQLIQSEKLAALGGLVAGVAHEINTPVGISVTAASSLVEETNRMADHYKTNKISRAEFKDYLNTTSQTAKLILSNMQRTDTMVQSFKQVSVDQSTEQQRTFRLKEYSEDIIRSLYPRLKGMKVEINLDIDEKLEFNSYPGAYSQILTNLILNSLVHGFDGKTKGNITISANMDKEQLLIEYRDNGKGIVPELMDKIFEPYFTTNKKVGTGLGMHIVYNLVTQKLNGSISCSSEPGKGVQFQIKLP
jgi:signal transduction histidine kinase